MLAATVFSGGLAIGVGIWGGVSVVASPFGKEAFPLALAAGIIMDKEGNEVQGSSSRDLERNLKFYPKEMHADIIEGVAKISQVENPFVINLNNLTRQQAVHLVVNELDIKPAAAEYVLDTAGFQANP